MEHLIPTARAGEMTALFGEDETLTPTGKKYDERIKAALRPIVADATREGLRLWELAIIIAMAMNLEIAFAVTQRRFDKDNKG